MEFVVYILYSEASDKFYIGYTSNLVERFRSHNFLANKGWTIRFRPWQVVYVEFYESKSDAIRREKQLKQGKGREWIRSHIEKQYKAHGFISA